MSSSNAMLSPVAAAAPFAGGQPAAFAGGQPDPMQANDAWQEFIVWRAKQQQHTQQHQPPYHQPTTTTPAPYNAEYVGGLSPPTQGATGHYDLPAGSTSQGPASPLIAPGDLEAGPLSIDQVWGAMHSLQQQVAKSQQKLEAQLASLLAALPGPTGAPPGVQPMPVPSATGAAWRELAPAASALRTARKALAGTKAKEFATRIPRLCRRRGSTRHR